MNDFKNTALPTCLQDALAKMGFVTPTPIQAQAIPLALEGRDILGSAQTGTGKTGAFAIPVITKLLENPKSTALILTPTRELAAQVIKMATQLLEKDSKIKTALLIGGESIFKQFQALKFNPRLVVGTPGRINDHLARKTLDLSAAHYLVLDETDRMLDMGFGIQLDAILEHVPTERQTLMFSATMPKNIIQLSKKYLKSPERITVGSTTTPHANITQHQVKTNDANKFDELLVQLKDRPGTAIIFVKTKHGADRLAAKLNKSDYKADALHGDLRQNKRDRVIQAFRACKFQVLVATDVAARGLDIPHIEYVINYDLPPCPEDYIHRIGRTARAGAAGTAINLITPADQIKWKNIERLINDGVSEPQPQQRRSASSRPAQGRDGQRPSYGRDGQRPAGRDGQKSSYGRDAARPAQGRDDQRSSYGRDATKPAQGRDGQKSSYGRDAARPAQGRDDQRSSYGRDAVKPAQGRDDQKSSYGRDAARPAQGRDDQRPGQGRDGQKPSFGKKPSKPFARAGKPSFQKKTERPKGAVKARAK